MELRHFDNHVYQEPSTLELLSTYKRTTQT